VVALPATRTASQWHLDQLRAISRWDYHHRTIPHSIARTIESFYTAGRASTSGPTWRLARVAVALAVGRTRDRRQYPSRRYLFLTCSFLPAVKSTVLVIGGTGSSGAGSPPRQDGHGIGSSPAIPVASPELHSLRSNLQGRFH